MKNLKKITFLLLAFTSTAFYAQVKTGVITYDMTMSDNEEMAAMGSNTIKVSFTDKSNATQIDMIGGMISIKTITIDKNEPKNTRVLMDAMGQKLEIVGEANLMSNSELSSLKNAESVTYNKKDTKKILGFDCYKAFVKMNNGTTSDFYITEAITPQNKPEDKVKLTGYPLEITVNTERGKVNMLAVLFEKEPSVNCFVIPEGYEKVTPEELEQKLGGF